MKGATIPEDSEIIQLFHELSTRELAYSYLLQKYQQKLYWHIRRFVVRHEDADDVLQNTCIKIWENLMRFRSDSRLYTWLFRIATNEALQFVQKQRAGLHISMDAFQEEHEMPLHADSYFDGNRAERTLQEAILGLPDKQKLVFHLRYFEQMSYEEISEVCGTSEGALKASYHHAVQKIEKYLQRSLNQFLRPESNL